MKRFSFIILAFCIISVTPLFSETQLYNAESEHYIVYSEISAVHAQTISQQMEKLFDTYNSYFHFTPSSLSGKMKVRIFSNKDRFNNYLKNVIDAEKEDFVYLHYSDIQKSELVGFSKEAQSDFDASIAHQGSIQFLKAFISAPPLWMREGFAILFETCSFDRNTGELSYRENLSWLPTLRDIINSDEKDLLSLTSVLTMDQEEAKANFEFFYPQSWGMVSFLMNTDKTEYQRMLWDSIRLLDADAKLVQNSKAIKDYILTWVSPDKLSNDFTSYLQSRKTFNELVQSGINAYKEESYAKAKPSFERALELRTDHPLPFYYLGLLHYNNGNYEQAQVYYQKALSKGADKATTYYAMGVNSFAAKQFDDATDYLNKAKENSPDKYTEKVSKLLSRIEIE